MIQTTISQKKLNSYSLVFSNFFKEESKALASDFLFSEFNLQAIQITLSALLS